MENWWKRNRDEKVDPKLEGKSQADILKMIEDADKNKERIAQLEADRARESQQISEFTNSYNAVKARLDQIEANSKPPQKQEPESDENFIDNPDGAFNQRAKPIAQLAVGTAVTTAKMLAQSELDNRDMASNHTTWDGRLFRQWNAEILQYANQKTQLELTNPQVWIDLYLKVKGLHAEELGNAETRKKSYAFMESAVSSAPPTPEDKSKLPADRQLSESELKVANAMKISPEQYLKRKNEMQFLGA